MSGRLQGGVGSPILFSLTVFGPLVAIFVGHLLVGGFDPFTSLYLALAVIGMGGVCIAGSPDSRPVLSDRALWLAGLCFMIPTGIALVQAMTPGFDREYAFLAFIRFCGLSALVVMGGMIGQSSRRLFYFQLAFVGAMLVFGVFMLVTFELDSANLAPINAFQDRERLSGTFFSPNSAGLVCALGAVICLAIILDRARDAGRSDAPGFPRFCSGWRR